MGRRAKSKDNRMKTIKELTYIKNNEPHYPEVEITIDALKDVLGLLKTNKTKEEIIKEIEG